MHVESTCYIGLINNLQMLVTITEVTSGQIFKTWELKSLKFFNLAARLTGFDLGCSVFDKTRLNVKISVALKKDLSVVYDHF